MSTFCCILYDICIPIDCVYLARASVPIYFVNHSQAEFIDKHFPPPTAEQLKSSRPKVGNQLVYPSNLGVATTICHLCLTD